MFVSKNAHSLELARVIESYESQLAHLKSSHSQLVSVLKDQISDLRQLVFSPRQEAISPQAAEADRIITQNEDGPSLPGETSQEELRERDAILSGSWDDGMYK